MNFEPLRTLAAQMSDFFAAAMTWLAPEQADATASLLMPALAGIGAAIVVALVLALLSRARYQSFQIMIRRGLAVAIALLLLAFAAYDIHNAAHADLAKTSMWSATEFELHWQKTTARARELAVEMGRNAVVTSDLPQAHRG
jgi:hypothetical protein